jgi:hypothetical protein
LIVLGFVPARWPSWAALLLGLGLRRLAGGPEVARLGHQPNGHRGPLDARPSESEQLGLPDAAHRSVEQLGQEQLDDVRGLDGPADRVRTLGG